MAHVVDHVDTRGVLLELSACAPEAFRFFLPGAAWCCPSALLSSFFFLGFLGP
jgi:hypothetical protein